MLDSLLAPILGQALAQGLTAVLGDGFFAVGVPLVIRALERSHRFPWLTEYSGKALKITAAIAGALASAGIKSALDIGAGTFVVSGITTTGLGLFAFQVVKQLSLQEVVYQWFLKGPAKQP